MARRSGAEGAGRRLADPVFPRSVRLLGAPRPLIADRRMPHRQRHLILAVVRAAAAKLDAEHRAGLLSAGDRRSLDAIRRFELGWGRSGQDRSVFIFGLTDVEASGDPVYWTSALVHDGAHALMQGRGGRYYDEVGPCNAQIDYLIRTGANDAFIDFVTRYRDSRARQRTRSREQT